MCNKFDSQPAAELAADGGESHGPIRKMGTFGTFWALPIKGRLPTNSPVCP